jgi:homoserine kinase type II
MLDKNLVTKILKQYGILEYKIEPITDGIENTNLIIHQKNKRLILRIYDKQRNQKEVELEIKIIEYLTKNNIPIPRLIKNKNNNLITIAEEKISVLMQFIEGIHPEWRPMGEQLGKDIGENQARMNKCLLNQNIIKNNIKKESTEINVEKEVFINDFEFNKKINENIKKLKLNELRKCFIHKDISRENIIINKDKILAFLDFDDCSYSYLIYDVAVTITQLFITKSFGIDYSALTEYYTKYNEILPLRQSEKEALITLIVLRNIEVKEIVEEKLKTQINNPEEIEDLNSIIKSVSIKIDIIKENYTRLLGIFLQ